MLGLNVSSLPMDLILNILNIILLFVIVRALVWKPVKKFLSERNAKLEEKAQQAQQDMQNAQDLKAEYEKLLSDSEVTARNIINESRHDADRQAKQILDEARQSAAEIQEDARLQAEAQRQKLTDGMQDEVINLAFDISAKLLNREINDEDNRRIAESFFESQTQSGE